MAIQQTSEMPKRDKPAVGSHRQRSSSHIHSSLLGLLRIAIQRLWNHRGLMLAITAGFTIAIALVVSIPVYAEAVGYRVLRDEFARNDADNSPLSFEFRYQYLATEGSISWDQVAQLDRYITNDATNAVRMPVQQHGRFIASNKRPLTPANSDQPLQGVNLAFADDLAHNHLANWRQPVATYARIDLQGESIARAEAFYCQSSENPSAPIAT